MQFNIRLIVSVVVAAAVGIAGCNTYQEPEPPRDALYYPIGVEMHPDGQFLYVVNSNFDLRYRDEQGGVVSVINTEAIGEEDDEILPDASPFLPSFGGHLALNEEATKAYVTSRQNNEVTVLSVADDGEALYCDVDGDQSADTRPCSVRRIPDQRDGARVPTDPFDIAVNHVERVDDGELHGFDVAHLSHLGGSEVTAISFPDGELAGATMRSGRLVDGGGSQIRIRPGTNEAYVASRRSNRIDGFSPFVNDYGEVEAIVRGDSIPVTERDRNVDARGLDFDESGDWMYVATRNPSALHIVAMETGAGGPAVVTSIPIEHRPSEVQAHRGADGVERIYVPSYRHGSIEVIEPDREAVVETIDVGRSPYSMTIDPRPAHCEEPGERCLAYVTLFDAVGDGFAECRDEAEECGLVAVVDLDPASDNFHSVVETID